MKNRYIISNTCERKLSNYIDIGGAENEKNISTKKRQNKKEHGFMKRMSTRAGRNVIKARRAKGREKLSA